MANNCYYMMKVQGTESNVKEFFDAMRWQGKYEGNGVGRVFDCDCTDEYASDNGYAMVLEGDCAWSINSSMIKDIFGNSKQNDIVTLSMALCLIIEAYSEEQGEAFQEHYVFDNGEVLVDETVDWNCFYLESLESDSEYMSEFLQNVDVIQKGITADNYKEFVNENGDIVIGGFDSWNFR